MNIKIKDLVGLSAQQNIELVNSLLENRKPNEHNFDYGFETHGAINIIVGIELSYHIQVYQSNKRKSNKSPIEITIEKHTSII